MAGSLTLRQGMLAALLTATAGFVDGLAFIHLGGYFVSFMSGNSTRAGADLATGDLLGWAKAMGLVGFFVAGVVASSLAVHLRTSRAGVRESAGPRSTAVWVSLLLILAAAVFASVPALQAAVPPAIAAGMGAVNGTFTRGGEVTVGLTYMTGTLVKTGQHLAHALTGGNRTVWLRYLALWAAIAIGSIAGAMTYRWLGLGSLWAAVVLLLVPAVLLGARLRRPA
ncbi:YoaK family protein [Citricoccus parietis]|uniref:YoaK family protein n=1 Tax=Citricoccus parietis TaxID=592307 RepID=A0ABV6F823_9MICC